MANVGWKGGNLVDKLVFGLLLLQVRICYCSQNLHFPTQFYKIIAFPFEVLLEVWKVSFL